MISDSEQANVDNITLPNFNISEQNKGRRSSIFARTVNYPNESLAPDYDSNSFCETPIPKLKNVTYMKSMNNPKNVFDSNITNDLGDKSKSKVEIPNYFVLKEDEDAYSMGSFKNTLPIKDKLKNNKRPSKFSKDEVRVTVNNVFKDSSESSSFHSKNTEARSILTFQKSSRFETESMLSTDSKHKKKRRKRSKKNRRKTMISSSKFSSNLLKRKSNRQLSKTKLILNLIENSLKKFANDMRLKKGVKRIDENIMMSLISSIQKAIEVLTIDKEGELLEILKVSGLTVRRSPNC